jgi:hypothetical protein
MDRISGWYKRKAHAVLWVIAMAVCIALNADSFTLASTFWNDQALRAATVAAATDYVNQHKPSKTTTQANTQNPSGSNANAPGKDRAAPAAAATDQVNQHKSPPDSSSGAGSSASNANAQNADPFQSLKEVQKNLTKINLPLGWCWNVKKGDTEKSCWPNLNPSKDARDATDVGQKETPQAKGIGTMCFGGFGRS